MTLNQRYRPSMIPKMTPRTIAIARPITSDDSDAATRKIAPSSDTSSTKSSTTSSGVDQM
jgi:hypothetical protein